MSNTYNIARRLQNSAVRFPHKRALVYPQSRDAHGRVAYTQLTFAQLEALASRYARGLRHAGIGRGTKTLLMVRMSLDFTALAFALFKIGAVPVMIDPGMGVRGFLNCVRQVEPEGFIGIPKAHILRLLCRRSFRHVRVLITMGRCWFWGGLSTANLGDPQYAASANSGCSEPPADCRGLEVPTGPASGVSLPAVDMGGDELAAILFTSGSTGPAKGVEYTHRIFETQVQLLQDDFGIGPDNIDLPCFPLFGLFSTGLGCTAIIPDMDPTRPAKVNPERIIEAVNDHGVTYSFGSPALWRTVGTYCRDNGVRLPTLKRIYMAGAPVPEDLHRLLFDNLLPNDANTFTPYGATESLPVSCIDGRQVVAETAPASARGEGICVGKPVSEATVRVIRITDDEIAAWDDSLLLPDGEIGEIVVKGPMVTPAYYGRERQTRLAKIMEDGSIWHRVGDLGYFDGQGRLWMCGRKAHRVQTAEGLMCTVRCEAVFNNCPHIVRSALVGVGEDRGRQIPVLVVEPGHSRESLSREQKDHIVRQLLELGRKNELTRPIKQILFYSPFPVDVRHNAKINREKLAEFATRRLMGRCAQRSASSGKQR